MKHEHLTSDVLILGAGGAGLRAAVEAAEKGAKVLVASKMGPDDINCTVSAWGGFTYAPEGREDELFRQVVETGGYLNNQRLVEVFAHDTPRRMRELIDLGLDMEVLDDADKKNQLGILKLRGKGRTTGFGMTRPLRARAEALGAKFMDRVMISRLITNGRQVAGAVGVNLVDGSLLSIAAKAVVIAAGGGACLYERTDNPAGATADGIALAYEAGAELVDMECVSFQFPKDRVAQVFQVKQPPDEELLRKGTAHYFLGGIKIDERCCATLDGLYAAGETAGGLFGAARLGGAAMADIVVFGAIAGAEAAAWARGCASAEPDAAQADEERRRIEAMLSGRGEPTEDVAARVRSIMWRNCGAMKTHDTLTKALDELDRLPDAVRVDSVAALREGIECLNMRTVARRIAEASRLREETRGCFWRIDFPRPDNAKWVQNIHQWRSGGEAKCEVRPAVMTRLTSPGLPRIGAGCFSYLPQP
ncbi:MAG: FAD-dependent oxidoreductase [Planctomycetota bacterium]